MNFFSASLESLTVFRIAVLVLGNLSSSTLAPIPSRSQGLLVDSFQPKGGTQCVHVYKVRQDSLWIHATRWCVQLLKLYKRKARVRCRQRPGASENLQAI